MGFIMTLFVSSSKLIGEARFILVVFSFALELFAVATKVILDYMRPEIQDRYTIFV